MVPFDVGHEEDVGKRQAGHRGGHPKGHGVGGFVDAYPVPALFDLQSSTPRAQSDHWQKQQYASGERHHSHFGLDNSLLGGGAVLCMARYLAASMASAQ